MRDWIDMRGMTDDQADAALVISQRDRAIARLAILDDVLAQIVTIADEAFGLGPMERIEDTLTRIERGIRAMRQRETALEAEVQRLLCWTVGAYVDGEIVEQVNHAQFEAHLAKCEACQHEVHSLMQLVGRLSGLERSDG